MRALNKQPTVGILAVQGDFTAHAKMLRSLEAGTVEVRTVADLEPCDALVLPGGESTTQLQFLQEEGLFEAIRRFAAEKRPVFGTCAGAILLAADVQHPAQESLGLLDMTVLRNAYGRQLASDVFLVGRRWSRRRWRWCSSALPSSRGWVRVSKSLQSAAENPCWCRKKIFWQRLFILNSPAI